MRKLDRTSGEISGAVQEPEAGGLEGQVETAPAAASQNTEVLSICPCDEDDAWAQPYTIIASNAAGMASCPPALATWALNSRSFHVKRIVR